MKNQSNPTSIIKRLLDLFVPIVLLLFFTVQLQAQMVNVDRETAVTNGSDLLCRFGVNALEDPTLTNLPALRAGWYMNFTTASNPSQPSGMEYMQTIRFKPNAASPGYTYEPNGSDLSNVIAQNTGVKWIIGNEPDSPFQDNLTPAVYARAYNELYHLIKNQDPTAQIIVGSIVQPTPVRLLYLDMILSSYYAQFDTALPADGWSFHNYILNEVNCDVHPDICWGAFIPPGINWDEGEIWGVDDNDRVDVFTARITRFRQWMADRGYTGQPLYLTEYGILMPEDLGYPPSRVNAYMDSTFDYMMTAVDSKLGDPNDGFKLVQQWSWFSTTDDYFNGTLFDKYNSYSLTEMGHNYITYTSNINSEVDFYPSLISTASSTPYSQGEPVTTTLRTVVANSGNLTQELTATVKFYDGDPLNGGSQIGSSQTVSLSGCGNSQNVTMQWANILPGVHDVYVQVVPASGIVETNTINNLRAGQILVSTNRIFLPILTRALP